MAITTAFCTSAKSEYLRKQHDLGNAAASPVGGDTIKLVLIALGSPAGTYGAASTNYTDVTGNGEEAADSNSPASYPTGGGTLTNNGVTTSGTTAYADFQDITFTTVNMSADGCMLINSSLSNAALSLHDFGGLKTASGGDFTCQFPTADASNAVIRIA